MRQKHAGMEQDEGSNLSHTLWRQQDYLSGRWTSPDPYTASMTIADPQSFNRYSYVNNDPVNKVDPLGLMLSDIGVYQTDNPQDARIAEQQSWRNLQVSVNSYHARRNGGTVKYKGNHAVFTRAQQDKKIPDQSKQPSVKLPDNPKGVEGAHLKIDDHKTKVYNNEVVKDADGNPRMCAENNPCKYGFEVTLSYSVYVPEGFYVDGNATEEVRTTINGETRSTPWPPAPIVDRIFQDTIGVYSADPITGEDIIKHHQVISVPLRFVDVDTYGGPTPVRTNAITINMTDRTIVIQDITDYSK